MVEDINQTVADLKKAFEAKIVNAGTPAKSEQLKHEYLGRQGIINQLFKSLPIKENPNLAKQINLFKKLVEEQVSQRILDTLTDHKEEFDVTIPGNNIPQGSLHLLTGAIEEIEGIFSRLGFARRRYPEVETDWYYAEGLNIPKDHPARDDQETFYLDGGNVLTAHTSNGQLREMEAHVPPIKMINIGKTYRRQLDATHTPMFHQFEGLVVDKGINITNLVGVVDYFIKSYFGLDRVPRLRPHHFQFTEPSFEIDISCGLCHGTSLINQEKCRLCKSGWLELGGAGMVHPQVLKNGGIDPEIYSGFAFGWGVERILMMKSGLKLPDLRMIYSDDIRFLSQF